MPPSKKSTSSPSNPLKNYESSMQRRTKKQTRTTKFYTRYFLPPSFYFRGANTHHSSPPSEPFHSDESDCDLLAHDGLTTWSVRRSFEADNERIFIIKLNSQFGFALELESKMSQFVEGMRKYIKNSQRIAENFSLFNYPIFHDSLLPCCHDKMFDFSCQQSECRMYQKSKELERGFLSWYSSQSFSSPLISS